MVIFGSLLALGSATSGVLMGWQNRNTPVRARIGALVWTGHLSTVLIAGALLACWFGLGVAFVTCRLAELRRQRGSAGRRARAGSVMPARTRPSPRQRSHV